MNKIAMLKGGGDTESKFIIEMWGKINELIEQVNLLIEKQNPPNAGLRVPEPPRQKMTKEDREEYLKRVGEELEIQYKLIRKILAGGMVYDQA